MYDHLEPQEAFEDWTEYEEWLDSQDESWYPEDDGQPDEYTEWQDVYGGDNWDHGQYDEVF